LEPEAHRETPHAATACACKPLAAANGSSLPSGLSRERQRQNTRNRAPCQPVREPHSNAYLKAENSVTAYLQHLLDFIGLLQLWRLQLPFLVSAGEARPIIACLRNTVVLVGIGGPLSALAGCHHLASFRATILEPGIGMRFPIGRSYLQGTLRPRLALFSLSGLWTADNRT